MQNKGANKKTVISELKKILQDDQKYDDGRILCSMCTKPNSTARAAHEVFLDSNLGDPGLYPGTVKLEKEAIADLAAILNGVASVGFLVSGGTEANLLAMLAARNMVQVDEPEVILPKSAHFSLEKICNMLKLKPVYAELDSAFRVDAEAVEGLVNERTVAIVGSAGTSEIGVIDPIEKLSAVAEAHGVYLHVDAAFGGLVIPFLKNSNSNFDFRLEGVQSITVDPHKMGMTPIPTGGILFRNKKALEAIKTQTPYLTDQFQYTFTGTRSGASAAATWAVFRNLGYSGFEKTIDECMKTTHFLRNGIANLGLKLVVEPTLNILAFRSENTKHTAEQLRLRGWFVSYIPRLDSVRIIVMPHVKKKHAEAFLKALSEVI